MDYVLLLELEGFPTPPRKSVFAAYRRSEALVPISR